MMTPERIRELATEMTTMDIAKLIAHVYLNEQQQMQHEMARAGDFKAKQILSDKNTLADGAICQVQNEIFKSMFQHLVVKEITASAEEYVRD